MRKRLVRAQYSAGRAGSKVLTLTSRLLGMTYRSGYFFVLQDLLAPYAIGCKVYAVLTLLFASVAECRWNVRDVGRSRATTSRITRKDLQLPLFPISVFEFYHHR
ncbi:hypothetical protein BDV34DRAFT_60318 [Aspergillus parasiticus]|uniref:Uncharacterized protein n=1 Tax=Aspergillus parasiticus TaxID=5067 RepID=A0A5N6DTH6_ASPPA|nr:hypothetical protein BDV34DRAFT_60318 [Aspergillus parasiticus]